MAAATPQVEGAVSAGGTGAVLVRSDQRHRGGEGHRRKRAHGAPGPERAGQKQEAESGVLGKAGLTQANGTGWQYKSSPGAASTIAQELSGTGRKRYPTLRTVSRCWG